MTALIYSPTPYSSWLAISIISITALLLVDTADVLSLYLFNEARDPLFVYFLAFTVLSVCTGLAQPILDFEHKDKTIILPEYLKTVSFI